MANSLRASREGLAIVDRARLRRGWTKTSTPRWWQDAHTSRTTLRRFWQGDRIQQDIFIALCQAVGITNWEEIAAPHDLPDSSTPYLDWDEAPDLENFYGRSEELHQLEQWIVTDLVKLVGIVGMGGIGKTSLALALTEQIQEKFESIIWRSRSCSPSLFHLLNSFNKTIDTIDQGIIELINYLRHHRCLLILDGWETNSEYDQVLQQLSHARHQSCVMVTSREKSYHLAIETKTIRTLTLKGLPETEALKLLEGEGFTGKELGLSALIKLYRGHPLALKIVTPLIKSVFGGNISAFLHQNTLVIGDRLRGILKQQWEQLSTLEQEILYWLAIWQEPVTFCRLQTHLLISPAPDLLLEAIETLERRSLLEKWFNYDEPSFTLQPLVMKMVTEQLVEQGIQEISQVLQSNDLRYFNLLRTHWLLRPGSDILVGDRLLTQLREQLWRMYGAKLPQILEQILLLIKGQNPLSIGYIGCNLMVLLKQF